MGFIIDCCRIPFIASHFQTISFDGNILKSFVVFFCRLKDTKTNKNDTGAELLEGKSVNNENIQQPQKVKEWPSETPWFSHKADPTESLYVHCPLSSY